MAQNLDLSAIFSTVTEQLSQNKDSLNEADGYNHDHGDHMIQIFDVIKNAVAKKKDKPVAEQLEYASQAVTEKADSGSGKLYAEGLANAAKQFTGNELNAGNIGTLVQSLMGAEKPQEAKQPEKSKGFFGSLLSGLTGKSQTESSQDKGLGMDDLFRAGMAFYQSKQEGDQTTSALMDALMSASPLGESAHRSQSGSIVASTIMDFVKGLGK
jgi:hypothetical protein